MTARRVSVGIVNHNGESYLRQTLRAVARLGPAVDDVLLIDSGSTDRGGALVREQFPQVRVIELGANLGPGAARNRAIREAAHDRVLLIDNDVEPQPGSVEALGTALDGHPNAILAMAAVLYERAPDTVQYVGAVPHFLGTPALLQADTPVAQLEDVVRVVGTAITCCVMVDRARFGDRRWFDERLFIYLEDHEFGLRASLQGYDCLIVPAGPVPAPGGHHRRVGPRDGTLHPRPGPLHHPQSLVDGPDAVPGRHAAPVRAGAGRVRGVAAARRGQERLDRPLALGGWIDGSDAAPCAARAPGHADEPATRGPRDPDRRPLPLQPEVAALRAGARGAARPRPGRPTQLARGGRTRSMKQGKIRRDLLIAFASQLAFKVLGFAVLAVMARLLSQAEYGKLMFALTLCGVTVLVTDLGASTDLSRRVAAAPGGARRRLEAVLSARLPLLAAYLVLLPAWVAVTKPDALAVAAAIAVYSVCKDVYRTYSSLFQGLHRIGYTVVAFGASLRRARGRGGCRCPDRRRVGVDDRGPRAQRRGAAGCGGRHHATQDRAHPAPMAGGAGCSVSSGSPSGYSFFRSRVWCTSAPTR